MANDKPLPLMVDGKPHYTLSSYEPAEVEVMVATVTGDDLEFALDTLLEGEGGSRDKLSDAAWLKEHFQVSTPDELYELVNKFVTGTNSRIAEEQKMQLCLAEMADRLLQQPLPEMREQCRRGIELAYEQRFAQGGVTRDEFLRQARQTAEEFNAMIEEQADMTARQQAALSAIASERKVQVSEEEIPMYLGVAPEDAQEFLNRARATRQLDDVHEAAVRSKAASIVVAESSCTYHHETTEEAKGRMAKIREVRSAFEQSAKEAAEEDEGEGATEGPGLHLV